MFTVLSTLLASSGIVGLLFWWQNTYWGPQKKRALLHREPLLLLREWGFELTEAAYTGELFGKAATVPAAYVGHLRGYAVEISFGWEEKPHFLVRVFFDPGSRDYDTIMRSWRAADKAATRPRAVGKHVYYAPVYADARLSYNFLPPKATRLIALAEQLLSLVQRLPRKPIPYQAGCELASTVLAESRRRAAAGEAPVF